MIKYLNEPVTYQQLKHSDLFNLDSILKPFLLSVIILSIIAICLQILDKKGKISKKLILIILAVGVTMMIMSPIIFGQHFMIKDELKHNHPQYRNVHVTSHIDDISNGSKKDTQELRFTHNNKNYYVTIPSKVPATTNDEITIDIKKQMVDDRTGKQNLSRSINDPKNNITIKHLGKTHHTTAIITAY